ncbi:serine/threonine-protein kinase dbf2 [Brettanomyces nanus]|uniref:non-specific serine/threonine protein kinase n=1 Tax=Eeniella nana TaxID=13502 RepID=A0A875RWB6_EENNA|nr:serine/threonine-protein kinase dbf2 [Brettanomyces nanus]QPG73511.1 serine/threonine-protein kinase dbf2 [Brettanomyces nanus]
MTLMGGIFNRSPKNESNYIEELSKDVESLRFGPAPSTPNKISQATNNSFMSICSNSPGSSPKRNKVIFNKENTAPSTPSRHSMIPQLYTTPKTVTHQQFRSPGRIGREFYKKANSPKTKRLVTVCQMYFLDYYCDLFDYVISRRDRIKQVEEILDGLPFQERSLQWNNYVGRERAFLRKKRTKPRNKDFHIVTQVGQGGYGQVFLAKKKDTKEICALKVLNKKLLTRTDETRHVLTERDILTNTRSEWLVKLFYAFQDTDNVYMAMEFVPGGDFRTLLNNAGYLIPQHARFYVSEMFAAVNSLHQLGYTHRDLKPENFLIDAKGHIKLTDFGLAAGSISTDRIESMKMRLNLVKDLEYRPTERTMRERQEQYRSLRARDIHYANSIVGSPDYMALEVLEGKPYDYTVDYWSLGCMLFEALVGYTPFSGGSSDETYANLKSWKAVLKRPRYENGRYVFSDRTWQLITRLIATPDERLRTFKQVMAMPYFSDVNWDNLRERVPPFTPQLDNEEDAGYFDDFTCEDDMAKYKDVIAKRERDEKIAQSSIKADQKSFVGFTFKHRDNPGTNSGNILSPILLNGRSQGNDSEFGRWNEPFGTLY